jgi:hypothetical protein
MNSITENKFPGKILSLGDYHQEWGPCGREVPFSWISVNFDSTPTVHTMVELWYGIAVPARVLCRNSF